MSEPRTAVIAGAGIGGLSAALALARTGWRVDVYDQSHKIEPVGAGIQLGPNSSRILHEMGIMERVKDVVVETEDLVVRSGRNGRELSRMPHGQTARDRWGGAFYVIHRGDLQMALLDAARETPGLTVTLGRRLESIRQQERRAHAVFSKYGDELAVDSDLLIGADGLWSKARGYAGLTGPTNFSGCVAWRTVVPLADVPEFARSPRSNLWLGSGAHVVHYPIRGGKEVNIVAIVEDSWKERGWSEAGDIAWINRRFRGWHADLSNLIGCAEHWLRWSLFDRAPEWKWTRGPVALLGDAAHPMLPFLAQGASQAIEDAKVLGECMKDVADIPAGLMTYQDRRLRRAARVQRLSRRQAGIYHASEPIATARDLAMGMLGGAGLASRFDWLYGEKV